MLSIFDNREEEQAEKKLTLSRLQSVLGAAHAVTAEPPAPPAEQLPPTRLTPLPSAPSTSERRSFASKAQGTVPPSSSPPIESVNIPPELNEFAEQFTRSFREILVNTVKDIQAPINEEQRRLESLSDSLSRTMREVEALSSDFTNLSQRVDALSKSLVELSSKLGKIDDSLNIVTAAVHAVQEAQQAMEKRLELQAGAIRNLSNAVQAREDRLDRLIGTLQALQAVGSERPSLKKLPDEL